MKKTIKKIICLAMCALTLFAFAGCSGSENKELDIEKLSGDLLAQDRKSVV